MASETGTSAGGAGNTGSERRSDRERRGDVDRRQTDEPVDFPERRQEKRRAGEDRRQGDQEGADNAPQAGGSTGGEPADKRAGLDRREKKERRNEDDRRKTEEAITFPDRRKSARRTKASRRTSKGRRIEDDEVPVLDWDKDERVAAKKRERKRRLMAVGIFLAALVPVGAVNLYCMFRSPPAPPPERQEVATTPEPLKTPDPFKTMKARKRTRSKPTVKRPQEEIDRRLKKIERLREDILNTAPDIYSSVRLQLASGRYVDETNLAAEEELTVRAIQIYVKSDAWNKMKSGEKIKLLHDTYLMLRSRYPALTQFVSLRFDDGREDLELKFAAEDLIAN